MNATDAQTLGRLKNLLQQGQRTMAEKSLTGLIGARPDFLEARVLLAQSQAMHGDFALAEAGYRAALELAPKDPAAISGLGAVLNDLNRPAEGEAVLRRPFEGGDASWRGRIAHNLGVSLERQERHDEALAQFDLALETLPDHPLVQYNRAKTLAHLGRNEEAVDAYRCVLVREPANMASHEELNALLYRMGRDDAFLASYDEALPRALSARAPLLVRKGRFLMLVHRNEEARDCFAEAAKAAPKAVAPHSGLASAFVALGKMDSAIEAAETALKLRPRDPAIMANFATILLQAGENERALELTETATPLAPLNQGILAVYEVALRANDDPRAAHLADYERHVRIFDLDPPDGFSSMAAFNAALNARLDALHTDRREHFDQTLRSGTQTTAPLFESGDDLIQKLRVRIEQAVGTYIADLGAADPQHPLASRRTGAFQFAGSWSSRLRDSGFHINHVHPEGWISSCYYVEAPDAVEDAKEQQGWIKFGAPSFKTTLADPVRRSVQPAAGRLVLFPSYMWHGTNPFRSAQNRTTIAFDVTPA